MSLPAKIQHASLRSRLRLVIVVFATVVPVLACAGLTLVSLRGGRAEMDRELEAVVRLLQEPAAAVLRTGDTAAAQRVLKPLEQNPGLRAGALYRADGTIVARIRRGESEPPPPEPPPGAGFHPGRLEGVWRVPLADGPAAGLIYLRADPARQQALLRAGLVAGGLAALGGLLGGLVAAARLERAIMGPIGDVVQTAERIAKEEDFTLRAPATGTPELIQLVNGFNDMLARIQLRDVELRRHRDHLGELIAQGTAELMHVNQALAEARDKAEDASRAKSAFLANVSHELRTPLNAIIGYSEMILEEEAERGRPDTAPDLQRIRTAGKQLLGLINELLDLAKIEAGKLVLQREDFDLVALSRSVFDTVRPLAEQNQNRLELESASSFPVRADQAKVRQTLVNLLGNACKFTKRGQVRLTLSAETVADHPWAVIAVSDTGIGMSAEQLGRLFQEFSQADATIARRYGGTGLGLVLSQRFVEAMGGQLTVASEPGAGSTFTARLPARPLPVAPKPATPAAPATPTSGHGPCVLVIDDDANARDLMVRFLMKEGFSPHTAADGRQGLQMARQLRPALITLDVTMPEVDGWSVLTALKADPELAGTPVMMITLSDERDKSITLGAAEFITKPVDYSHLSALLRHHCPVPGDRPILVVEDDELSSHLLRRNLEREGYATLIAPNGRAALDLIRLHLPAVILLDLMMPEMDGFAFANAVRERKDLRDVPLIVLTGKELTEEDKLRLGGNVTRILQKQSTSPEALQRALRAALTRQWPGQPGG